MAGPFAAATELAAADPARPALASESGALGYGELIEQARAVASGLSDGAGPVVIERASGPRLLVEFVAAGLAGRPACLPQLDFAAAERRRALDAACGAGADGGGGFYIGFTSGTSGAPKAFIRGWDSWQRSFAPAAALERVDAGTTVVLPGALQHSHFLFGAIMGIESGAAVHTFERFDVTRLLSVLAGCGASSLFVVPTMLAAIEPLIATAGPLTDVRSVVISGSAYGARHREIARRAFPSARLVQIFGASELSFVTAVVDDPGDLAPGGDVGRAFPGVEIELRTPDGSLAPPSEPGEIWVRSPYLADGYLAAGGTLDPIAGADGFATVGDVGVLDGEGLLTLTGRGSNMVITGGKNVHPEEVEAVLREHAAVAECVVVGVDDDYWGERLVALIEPAAEVGDAELASLVRGRLAAHKTPKEWHRVGRLPRTAGGKVARAAARELVAGGG